jgi:hypothetical protein
MTSSNWLVGGFMDVSSLALGEQCVCQHLVTTWPFAVMSHAWLQAQHSHGLL